MTENLSKGNFTVPVKASIEDIQKIMGFLSRQIGWVESARIEKAFGALDDRKVAAMVEFGLVLRDGKNLRTTDRGQLFNTETKAALREVLLSVDLYKSTLDWVHYGKRDAVTTAEIGQYWEASHKDTIGNLSGITLGSGAVTFGRVIAGAAAGKFTVGRGGKETRIEFDLPVIDLMVTGQPDVEEPTLSDEVDPAADATEKQTLVPEGSPTQPAAIERQVVPPAPSVNVSASPSVHVNVEIHIAADATADTMREIFKNMARYVLEKTIDDDDK
ncbi:hypothetical protein [Rathayibacter tritici]|uniref:hypothetical protein n=1 Tax=Rathayibacter tritici TaxID=33888 RepID=UPI00082CF4D5|nr:hypothetical protein [Rathayibacter tritici]